MDNLRRIEWRYSHKWQLQLGISVLRALFDFDLVYMWKDEDCIVIEPQIDDALGLMERKDWQEKAEFYRMCFSVSEGS